MKSLLICVALLAATATMASAQDRSRYEVNELSDKQLRQLQALTPEKIAQDIVIQDDALEPVAVLSTEKAWVARGGFTDPVRSDNLLRALIMKSSGEVRFQLYHEVTYTDDWRRFDRINYLSDGAPASAPLRSLAQEVLTCQYGPCVHREVVAFDLPRELVEDIAAQYVPGASPLWRYRLKARNGFDWDDRLAPAEAAGLLMAVEKYCGE